MKRTIFVLLIAILSSGMVLAQENYPTKPIKVIVPLTAGSTGDMTARILAEKMSPSLGQPIVVENRGGATGTIGMQAVAKSKPDGYTLVLGNASQTVYAVVVTKSLGYDPLKDFAPVEMFATTELVLLVGKDLPVNNFQEFVALAKKPTSNLSFGVASNMYRLMTEMLKMHTGANVITVIYKGPAEARIDVMAGRVSAMFDTVTSALSTIEAGQLKPLVVFNETRRSNILPAVPRVGELGFQELALEGFQGILAPAGTPEPIVLRLNAEIRKAVSLPDVKEKFVKMGLNPTHTTPAEFGAYIAKEIQRLDKVARAAGIEKQ
jgi:tripartite-type tricarboxylate transporter receptor subunit TctC